MNRAFDRDRIRTSRRVGAIFSLIAVLFLVGALGLIASLNSTRSRRLSLNSNGSVSVPKLVNGQPTSKNPQGVPSGVDPRLWNARPVQAMLPLSLSSAGNATVLWVVTNTGHLLESTTAGAGLVLGEPSGRSTWRRCPRRQVQRSQRLGGDRLRNIQHHRCRLRLDAPAGLAEPSR